jgi:hypothetical protein
MQPSIRTPLFASSLQVLKSGVASNTAVMPGAELQIQHFHPMMRALRSFVDRGGSCLECP